MKSFYLEKLSNHITILNGSLVPYTPAVPLVYITAIIGVWVFVLGKVNTPTEALMYGAIFGFVLYAFYDLTNIATLNNYPWSIVIVDVLWGTFLLAIVTLIMFLVSQMF